MTMHSLQFAQSVNLICSRRGGFVSDSSAKSSVVNGGDAVTPSAAGFEDRELPISEQFRQYHAAVGDEIEQDGVTVAALRGAGVFANPLHVLVDIDLTVARRFASPTRTSSSSHNSPTGLTDGALQVSTVLQKDDLAHALLQRWATLPS